MHGLCDLLRVFTSVRPLSLAFKCLAPQPISNASHQSVCLHVYVAGQRLGKIVNAATNRHNNKIIVGRVAFYAVRVVSKESTRLVLVAWRRDVELFW
jgi:hypothetical protein